MMRKKYRIKIKMIKEVVMDHEQESKEKAKEDIIKVIENSTNENMNKIFTEKPIFSLITELLGSLVSRNISLFSILFAFI